MSRSNGPLSQMRGVLPQHWQKAADQDPAAQQGYAEGQPQPTQPQPNRYPPLQQGYGPADGQPHPAPAYRQQPAPTAPQGYYPAAPQASYQPVFDRYAAAPEPAQQGFDPRTITARTQPPQQRQPQQPAQGYAPSQAYTPPPRPSLYDTHLAQQGGAYEQWPQSPQAAAPQQSQAPRGYDFSNYMPAAAPPQEYAAQPPYQTRQPTLSSPTRHDEAQWQLGAAYDRAEEAAADANGYGAPQQANYQGDANGQLQAAGEHADYDQDDHDLGEYEEEEPRKSRRGLVMVSALIGAIALGGGMAYAYKTFVKPQTGNAQVAKVSAPKGPTKTPPAEAGGKQFPNQNSKLQDRLGDGSAPPATVAAMAPASASGGTPDLEGGVKRVPTVVVGRDGSMTAPAGMVVVGAQPARPAPAADVQPAAPAAAVAPPPAAPPPQARVAAVAPAAKPVTPVIANAAPTEAAPAPAPKKATPKKTAAARDDAAAPAGGTSAAAVAVPAAKAGGSGYVAVVASKNNRADAQKANADLEQRFEVLKGKVFDVQEADLSAQGKGVVYRSVVGPPGSRAFASGVCSELKAAGYNDCWPVAYSN
jgi:SPOR domain